MKTADQLKTTLRELVALPGVSGFEQAVTRYFQRRVEELVDRVEVDRYGNVVAWKGGRRDHPRLMLAAHLDEIGFIVRAVESDGFLRFDRLGGAADSLLVSRRVSVNGCFGVIGTKAGHLQSVEERGRVASVSDLYIDVGAASADEVRAMGIRIGDPVTFIGELSEFTGGHRVCGKGLDDRAGVAILIQTLVELRGTTPAAPLYAVGTVLEEVGLRGAAMVAQRIQPDYAIAIDGLSAGDTPDSSLTRDMPLAMGQGPVVLLAASSAAGSRGSIAHPAMKRYLLAAAEAERVPVQLATSIDRGSTDAAAIHLTCGGVPTISVGVPRRYSYSPNEMIDVDDAARAVRLLVRFVQDMEQHSDLGFL